MATKNHNLSKFDSPLPSAADMRFGIVVAEWNREVTEALLEGAVRTLRAAGCPDMNIQIKYVPGTFELSLGAQFFAEYTDVDAVIALGCVIQGDTRHFDFICQGVTQGITQLQIQWNMPIAFGVLTVNDMQQALDRCGGRHGNKGDGCHGYQYGQIADRHGGGLSGSRTGPAQHQLKKRESPSRLSLFLEQSQIVEEDQQQHRRADVAQQEDEYAVDAEFQLSVVRNAL